MYATPNSLATADGERVAAQNDLKQHAGLWQDYRAKTFPDTRDYNDASSSRRRSTMPIRD